MHVHILGICGTFMGGLAQLLKACGHRVTGADAHVYPPMSDQLRAAGIPLTEGYDPAQLDPAPDLVVIGNALSRGNPAVEAVLDRGLPYASGPEVLAREVLAGRWVLAVSGTHGKTTTASMLAWILDRAGLEPGYLIGGVPLGSGRSARLGRSPFFVIEADEYDTAFFDKRSKFVHYRPRTLIVNNIEFDHADIFPDLEAIRRQFHHLVRTIPSRGRIIAPADDPEVDRLLAMGCWTPVERVGRAPALRAVPLAADGSAFQVVDGEAEVAQVRWSLVGEHNLANGIAALAAARHAGVPPAVGAQALSAFPGVKRRLERVGEVAGVRVYDDFAHHPTAIATTLQGLRRRVGARPIVAVIEARSNTMRMGVHRDRLAPSLAAADRVLALQPSGQEWSLAEALAPLGEKAEVFDSVEAIIARLVATLAPGDEVLIMSNGAFGGIHRRLLEALGGRP